MTDDEIDAGARAVYEKARENIDCEAWDALPEWRRVRWHNAYRAAVAVRERVRTRPARTIRFESVEPTPPANEALRAFVRELSPWDRTT